VKLRPFAQKLITLLTLGLVLGCILGYSVSAQEKGGSQPSQEVSEVDGLPVLLKHLPDGGGSAVFIQDRNGLVSTFGDKPILGLVEFAAGTEAVAADFPAGRLLIVEYTTPQAASFADNKFTSHLAENPTDPPVVYRRIGNYGAFVFTSNDPAAASALLDQVKYEKSVQWLGEDPFLLQKIERYFALTGRDVAISTVLWISLVFAITIAIGVLAGIWYFRYRERKRASMTAFSDAGGLTRLNLDDLSEPFPHK
jgi:hypothetical protein